MSKLLSKIDKLRTLFKMTYDFSIACIAFWISLYLRYGTFPDNLVEDLKFNRFFFISMGLHFIVFIYCKLYKGVWGFTSTSDLIRVIKASLIATGSSLALCFFMTRLENIPRTMFVIHFLVLVMGIGGGRFAYRFIKEYFMFSFKIKGRENVLIIGAERAGEKLLRDIIASPDLRLNVVGFLDDDKVKKNALIHGKKVFGPTTLIPEIVKTFKVHKIFLAIPEADSNEIKKIAILCQDLGVEVKTLPKMDQILSGNVELSLLRNLNIEDLLGRQQIQLDTGPLSEMIKDQIILVTGAGGSIGSELCFQIAKFSPKILVLCDFCELFMYELEMKFKQKYPEIKIIPKILDIRSREKVEAVFKEYHPELVFHAAAYKHVPMMEYNPREAIDTNVIGTKIVAETALKFKADKFVMISTDKAVNPTNVMGASKRIAEMVITDLSKKSEFTQFISVRFGNVLGSNGSVIPLFRKQIEEGKDITVTHPDIIRYFMSIPEAAQLVLQAASIGSGGEIFVLDMGEPVKIVDLARAMIKLAGLREGKDINIIFSGLRPGEKLYEELFSNEEDYEITSHGKIRKSSHRDLAADFHFNLNRLIKNDISNADTIVSMIKSLVPEFKHFRLKNEEVENRQIQ